MSAHHKKIINVNSILLLIELLMNHNCALLKKSWNNKKLGLQREK